MRNVDIRVHLLAKSATDDTAIKNWLTDIGAVDYQWPQPEQELTGPEAVIGLAAKRCYMSFSEKLNPNLTRVRKDWCEYLENILKSGHGSVLEHASYTFAIEGVSRVFTGEMNRHRAGVAISEGSMRYIRYTDIPWWLPLSIRHSESDDEVLAGKKTKTREIFNEVFAFVEKKYTELVELWQLDTDHTLSFHFKKCLTSALRRIIPMGVATGEIVTLNIRSLRHILALRASEAAEEEICHVMSLIGKAIIESEPKLFCDFTQTKEGYFVPKYPKV